jgi:MFS family permease
MTLSALLALPEYKPYLQLRFFVAMGWHMQAVVVSWYIYTLTRDPLMLALLGAAEAVPALSAALPMGYLVDKMDKRTTLRIASVAIVCSAAVTAWLTTPHARETLGPTVLLWFMLSMVMVNGTARTMYGPAMFSILAAIVPKDMIPRASAVGSTVWQSAMIGGPLLAGMIYYGTGGATVAALTCVALMIVGSAGAWLLAPKPPIERHRTGSMRSDLTEGLRFILATPIVVGALSLDLFAVLFGGVTAILPIYADTILHVDERGLGMLRSAMSVGSVVMMLFLAWRPPGANAGRNLILAVIGFGLAMMAFGVSTTFWLSVAMLAVAGMCDSVSVVTRHTILQLYTPDHMRGRVAAANTMFISSSNELGAVESGVAARVLGTVPSVIFGATMTLIVVAIVMWKAPALRRLRIGE